MLSMPRPRRIELPALCDFGVNNLRLPQMALPRSVRPGQNASQEQLQIKMACSCPSSNVGSEHVDPAVPKLVTDSPPGLAIKVPIYLATFATVDWRGVLGDLLVALTCICRS